MSMHHINYADKNYAPTHIYQIQSIVSDTEMIEENHFFFSAIIQQISFAEDIHFHSTRIYAQYIPQSITFINISY